MERERERGEEEERGERERERKSTREIEERDNPPPQLGLLSSWGHRELFSSLSLPLSLAVSPFLLAAKAKGTNSIFRRSLVSVAFDEDYIKHFRDGMLLKNPTLRSLAPAYSHSSSNSASNWSTRERSAVTSSSALRPKA